MQTSDSMNDFNKLVEQYIYTMGGFALALIALTMLVVVVFFVTYKVLDAALGD